MDNVQVNQAFLLQQEKVNDILRKGDKVNIQKKDDKKKEVKKDKKQENLVQDIKITPLIDYSKDCIDYGKEINQKEQEKTSYQKVDFEGSSSMNVAFNNY